MKEIEIRIAGDEAPPADLARTVGFRIAQLREGRGWKQRELARRLGMVADRLSKIERGVREPRLAELMELARAFRLTLDEVVFGERPRVEAAFPGLLPPDDELKELGCKLFEAVAGGYELVLRTRRQEQPERPR